MSLLCSPSRRQHPGGIVPPILGSTPRVRSGPAFGGPNLFQTDLCSAHPGLHPSRSLGARLRRSNFVPDEIVEPPCLFRGFKSLFLQLTEAITVQEDLNFDATLNSGGERGIRTLDTGISRIHTFQACSFNHSDISPGSVTPCILHILITEPRSLLHVPGTDKINCGASLCAGAGSRWSHGDTDRCSGAGCTGYGLNGDAAPCRCASCMGSGCREGCARPILGLTPRLARGPPLAVQFRSGRNCRTLDTGISRIHTFQACSFNHLDISPGSVTPCILHILITEPRSLLHVPGTDKINWSQPSRRRRIEVVTRGYGSLLGRGLHRVRPKRRCSALWVCKLHGVWMSRGMCSAHPGPHPSLWLGARLWRSNFVPDEIVEPSIRV